VRSTMASVPANSTAKRAKMGAAKASGAAEEPLRSDAAPPLPPSQARATRSYSKSPSNGQQEGEDGCGYAQPEVEDIVKWPLPGFHHPNAFKFCSGDRGQILLGCLFSNQGTLKKSVHAIEVQESLSRTEKHSPSPSAQADEAGGNHAELDASLDCPSTSTFRPLAEAPSGSGLMENNMSLEEKLKRERSRERGLGITKYSWGQRKGVEGGEGGDSSAVTMMVPLSDGVYVQSIRFSGGDIATTKWSTGSLKKIIDTRDATAPGKGDAPASKRVIMDPTLSPDGRKISYVCDGRLRCAWLCSDADQEGIVVDKQLTFDETGDANAFAGTDGLAEFVAQEEMDRSTGHWWSPDSKSIAFARVDSSGVKQFAIKHHGKIEPQTQCGASHAGVNETAEHDEMHEYPFVGQLNVQVRLGVVHIDEPGEIAWTDVLAGGTDNANGETQLHGQFREEYLCRVGWFPDGRLCAQLQDRKQQTLQLVDFDPKTGKRTVLVEERTNKWINLHNCFRPLSTLKWTPSSEVSSGFLWASERDGFRHLYLYARDGRCLGQVTRGRWVVDSLEAIDEAKGRIFFTGNKDSEIERHLYCVDLLAATNDGGTMECGRELFTASAPARLTSSTGTHHVVVDPSLRYFVDVHDTLERPPIITLRELKDGSVVCALYNGTISPSDNRLGLLNASPPKLVTIKARDGTALHGAVYRPDPNRFGPGPYRTLVSVYGGPHVQMVSHSWVMTVDLRAQMMRSKGFLVFKLDNRGSARRGIDFESRIQYNMGDLEVQDQVEGVEWLVKQGLADAARVGIYGWSYGGYMSAMALGRAPDVFKAAIAGAPVISWDGYDTHYTERYMGLIEENDQGYYESSVMSHVDSIKGRLFLIHGMIDENVHFRHTVRLLNALNSASIEYDLLLFPKERHMPRSLQDRIYMEKRVIAFFERHL